MSIGTRSVTFGPFFVIPVHPGATAWQVALFLLRSPEALDGHRSNSLHGKHGIGDGMIVLPLSDVSPSFQAFKSQRVPESSGQCDRSH